MNQNLSSMNLIGKEVINQSSILFIVIRVKINEKTVNNRNDHTSDHCFKWMYGRKFTD